MTDEAREARNAYMREWRKKNKDKVKAARERHWEKKAREANEQEQQSQRSQGGT